MYHHWTVENSHWFCLMHPYFQQVHVLPNRDVFVLRTVGYFYLNAPPMCSWRICACQQHNIFSVYIWYINVLQIRQFGMDWLLAVSLQTKTWSLLFTHWTCKSTSCPWAVLPVGLTVDILNVTGLLETIIASSRRSSHNVLSAPSSRSAYVLHELPFIQWTSTGMISKQRSSSDKAYKFLRWHDYKS